MAAGSQKWNGKIADLLTAPTSTSRTAAVTTADPSAGQRQHDLVDLVTAGRLAQHDEADQHGQAAERGDDQRSHRGPAVRPPLGVVPDQDEREDRGEFPEDVEQQHVSGQHQAEHRAGEGDEGPGEPPERRVARLEVPGAVDQHQCADTGDQQTQRPAQGVEAQCDVQAKFGHPTDGFGDGPGIVTGHGAGLGEQPPERRRRNNGQNEERSAVRIRTSPGRARRPRSAPAAGRSCAVSPCRAVAERGRARWTQSPFAPGRRSSAALRPCRGS